MATANKVSAIPCGAMTADLTWLLLKPGRSIRDRSNKDAPAPWVDVPSHLEDFCASVEKLRGIQERTGATMVFGHDAEQIHQLRTAPEGSYT